MEERHSEDDKKQIRISVREGKTPENRRCVRDIRVLLNLKVHGEPIRAGMTITKEELIELGNMIDFAINRMEFLESCEKNTPSWSPYD